MQSLKILDLFKMNHDTDELRSDILLNLILQKGDIELISGELVTIKNCLDSSLTSILSNIRNLNESDLNNTFKTKNKYKKILEVENKNDSSCILISLSDIAKTGIFKGKRTLNAKGSKLTDEQENRSKEYIDSFINLDVIPLEVGGDKDWIESSKLHAQLVKVFLNNNEEKRKYSIFRQESIVIEMFDLIFKTFNIKISTWNPADIWMIESNYVNLFIDDLKVGLKKWNLSEMNKFFLRLFQERKVIPISLKKVNNRFVKYEIMNIEKNDSLDWQIDEIKFNMNWNGDYEFTTKDTTFYATGNKDGVEKDLLCQLKQYPWMSGNIQIEGRSKIALARYGKISTPIIDKYFSDMSAVNSLNLGRFMGENFDFETIKFVSWFNLCVKVFGDKFKTNFTSDYDFMIFLDEIQDRYKNLNNYTEQRILKNYVRCKLQGLKYFYDFAQLDEIGHLSECLEVFYNGALKINEVSSVYLKLG